MMFEELKKQLDAKIAEDNIELEEYRKQIKEKLTKDSIFEVYDDKSCTLYLDKDNVYKGRPMNDKELRFRDYDEHLSAVGAHFFNISEDELDDLMYNYAFSKRMSDLADKIRGY